MSSLIVHFSSCLRNTHGYEQGCQCTDSEISQPDLFSLYSLSHALPREVEEEPRRAEQAQDHVGRLDGEEDHEEAAGDRAGGHDRLEIRTEPFS